MFSSLLPRRSNESVTGGFKLKHGEAIRAKPLQRVAVNATGHCDKVLSALSEKCTWHALTMTIHPETPDCACLSCLGRNQDP